MVVAGMGGSSTGWFGRVMRRVWCLVEALGAAVHAARWGEGRGAVGAFGGAEDGGDVHGGFGRAELARGGEGEDSGRGRGRGRLHAGVSRGGRRDGRWGCGGGVEGGDVLGAVDGHLAVGGRGVGLWAAELGRHDGL